MYWLRPLQADAGGRLKRPRQILSGRFVKVRRTAWRRTEESEAPIGEGVMRDTWGIDLAVRVPSPRAAALCSTLSACPQGQGICGL